METTFWVGHNWTSIQKVEGDTNSTEIIMLVIHINYSTDENFISLPSTSCASYHIEIGSQMIEPCWGKTFGENDSWLVLFLEQNECSICLEWTWLTGLKVI